jgi:hypothetical protein
LPFSQANPTSSNYCPTDDAFAGVKEDDDAFRPHRGDIVKSVVFSQWTKLLDKICDALDQCDIRYARLDGSMNRIERNKAMETFKVDPKCEILLVSLRAGGVGCVRFRWMCVCSCAPRLNLTAAQRVYLMVRRRVHQRAPLTVRRNRSGTPPSSSRRWTAFTASARLARSRRCASSSATRSRRICSSCKSGSAASPLDSAHPRRRRKQDLANLSMSATLSKQELAKQRVEDIRTLLA